MGPLDSDSRSLPASRLPWVGLGVALCLVALAYAIPRTTGWDPHVGDFPPLNADWHPRVGPGTIPALVLAVLAVRYATGLAERLGWVRLLTLSYATGLAW